MNASLLIILPHNPGDVVMGLQAIRRLKALHPGLEVDYLVSEECRAVAEGSPLLRRLIVIPKRALKSRWASGDDPGLLSALESFLSDLGSVRYTLSANLFQERSGALIQSFVEADRKIGLELVDGADFQVRSRYLEHLFAVPANRGGNAWHAVDLYIRAIAAALAENPSDPPLARQDRSGAESRMERSNSRGPAGSLRLPATRAMNAVAVLPPLIRPSACASLAPGEYLAFHPGSAWPGKRWPEPQWAALARHCVRGGLAVAFTGAPEEKPMMARIAAAMDPESRSGITDFVGATDLAGAAWVCAHARMVVTGDTVAMHLAAAAGVPTLSLFGASNPVETGPYGRGHVVIQTDARPLPDLALEADHAGLARLRAEEVAEYLLEGIPPPGFAVWETGWDDARGMQILSDAHRLPHPALARSARLMAGLDSDAAGDGVAAGIRPLPEPGGLRGTVGAKLEACLADPAPERLAELEAADRELAEDTRDDLVWEAYRIALNGLPLKDIRSHLIARRSRFEQALREEALSRAP